MTEPLSTRTLALTGQERARLPRPLWIGGVLVALVSLFGAWIRIAMSGAPVGFDQAWHDLLAGQRNATATTVAQILNTIGGPTVMTMALGVVAVALLLLRRFREAAFFALSAGLATALSELLKVAVARPRPVDETLVAHGFAYPSGHTTLAAVVGVILIVLIRRWWAWVVAVGWVMLMAWSRTYLLVHWLSDTVAGAVLGSGVALIVWFGLARFMRPRRRRTGRQRESTVPGRLVNTVPTITLAFWVTKILTTGMGETTSDFFVRALNPVAVVAVTAVVLVGAMALQFAARRYIPWRYWFAVVMVSVFGTMIADVIHVQFGVPYLLSCATFLVALIVLLILWRRTQGTLSIHAIDSRPRELFYWSTVVTTFALGTAAGDLVAHTLGLGYLVAGVLFTVLFAVPGVAFRLRVLSATTAFWASYILTRPMGASFADWLGMPPERGGLDVGTGLVSAVLTVLIMAMVLGMSVTHLRREPARARLEHSSPDDGTVMKLL